MKIPLVKDVPKFEARKRLAERDDLSETERAILDAIDVLQQKADFAVETVVNVWNLVVLVAAMVVVINGPSIVKIVQSWIAPDYHARAVARDKATEEDPLVAAAERPR